MSNSYKINAAGGLRVPVLSADPGSPENGSIWYNSTEQKFKRYEDGVVTNLGGNPEFSDADFALFNDADNTKRVVVDLTNIATGQERTITMVDADVDLADVNNSLLLDGTRAMTGDLDLGGNKIVNLEDPTSAQDAATKAYVDLLAQGLSPKGSVRVATTANIDLSQDLENGDTLDGITLATGDRVLVKNQSTQTQNGVYIVAASGAASRASDFDGTPENEVKGGDWVFVEEGTANGKSSWAVLGNGNVEIGVDNVVFTKINQLTDIQAGDGVDISNDEINVRVDDVTIELDTSNNLAVKAGGIDDNHIASNAGINASKIANGSVSNTEFQYLANVTSDIQDQLDDLAEDISNIDLSGKANTNLNNLASVAINTSLISDTDNTDDLGSSSIHWKDLHVKSVKSTNGLTIDADSDSVGDKASSVSVLSSSVGRGKQAGSLVQEEYLDSIVLTNNTTAVVSSLGFAIASYAAIEVEYVIREATSLKTRVGKLMVVSDDTNCSITDTLTETADIGVSWSAAINAGVVEISYTTSNTGNVRTMRADAKRFRAI